MRHAKLKDLGTACLAFSVVGLGFALTAVEKSLLSILREDKVPLEVYFTCGVGVGVSVFFAVLFAITCKLDKS